MSSVRLVPIWAAIHVPIMASHAPFCCMETEALFPEAQTSKFRELTSLRCIFLFIVPQLPS